MAHKAHDEEWQLKNMIGNKFQPIHELVIPCRGFSVNEE